MVTIVFGAVSGSYAATVSCIGSIMTPRLKKSGYTDRTIGALLASSGAPGILIPPSMLMILYAWSAGTSVLACFLATVRNQLAMDDKIHDRFLKFENS